jgi:hypothetical protein
VVTNKDNTQQKSGKTIMIVEQRVPVATIVIFEQHLLVEKLCPKGGTGPTYLVPL